MILRMIKKDISRNRVIAATLFLFLLLASMLVSVALDVVVTLFGAMDGLFAHSVVPHYVQMHSGELDPTKIEAFAKNNPLVKEHQVVEMVGVDGAHLWLGGRTESEASSIVENSFVTQNTGFDFLLDTESRVILLSPGEVAVPLYHRQAYGLKIGDSMRIARGGFEMNLVIAAFVRDVQMNPSIITSKRFVLSEQDWHRLRGEFSSVEYSIEFLLWNPSDVGAFGAQYQSSGLPQKDTTITFFLFQVLSALTDGLMAAVIVLISILLIAVSALCLRFTLTATMEEDYREIGVMKAIGIGSKEIRKIYLWKYLVMAAVANALGYLLSIPVGTQFTKNIALYMGIAPKHFLAHALPALGSILVFLIVIGYCRWILRRFRNVSAVNAIRDGVSSGGVYRVRRLRLSKNRGCNTGIFLGIKAVASRVQNYVVLGAVFFICAFLMSVPFLLFNTLQSRDFVTYMGAGRSDLRIDLQRSDRVSSDLDARYAEIAAVIDRDGDVERHTALVTASYEVRTDAGEWRSMKIEVGDFSVFPLQYLEGNAPLTDGEIALSGINAEELAKHVGDSLVVRVPGNEMGTWEERTLVVSGIYQDVTNGGKTAKARLPYTSDAILWYVVNVDFADGVDITSKIATYNQSFPAAKLTSIDEYIAQTLGGLISQLRLAVLLAFLLAIALSVLVTAMFFKMLLAKEAKQVAIMRSLGVPTRTIRVQFLTRAVLILVVGIVVGFAASIVLGQSLASLLITGVRSLRFVVNPWVSFVFYPLALATAVGVTIYFSTASVRKINLMMVAES